MSPAGLTMSPAVSLGLLCLSFLPLYGVSSEKELPEKGEVKCNFQTPPTSTTTTPRPSSSSISPSFIQRTNTLARQEVLPKPIKEPLREPLQDLRSRLALDKESLHLTTVALKDEPQTESKTSHLGQHMVNPAAAKKDNQNLRHSGKNHREKERPQDRTDLAEGDLDTSRASQGYNDQGISENSRGIADNSRGISDNLNTRQGVVNNRPKWKDGIEKAPIKPAEVWNISSAQFKDNQRPSHVIPVYDPAYTKYWDKKQTVKQMVPGTWLASSSVSASSELAFRPPSDEERLLHYLFHHYNPSARPVINSSNTVAVNIQYSLMHIKDLDIRSQVFTTTGLLILEWTDERLTWIPQEHNNMSEVIVEAKGIWRPEFAVINGAEKIYEDYNQFRAVITHEGTVHWEPGGVFKTMCEIDITYYPFDEQTCVLVFGAWSYHTAKMNLTNISNIVNLDSYKGNGEWEVYTTQVIRNEFSYDCCPNERFANMAFEVYLRRRHTFYILNVILPSIMTSVLLLSVFFCTPGQKVQIGVVVLLSFRIFMLNVADNIPKTSDHIPILGIYLTCTMAITTLSMVLTVFVLNLHHITDKPVPAWLQRLVFIYVARLLGMCGTASDAVHNQEMEKSKQQKLHNSGLFRRTSMVADSTEMEERTAIIEMNNRGGNGSAAENGAGTPNHNHNDTATATSSASNPQHMHVHYVDANCRAKCKDDDKPEDYGKDWRRLAEIFDRLFFWLFLLAILISTLILFHPLTKSYMQQEGII